MGLGGSECLKTLLNSRRNPGRMVVVSDSIESWIRTDGVDLLVVVSACHSDVSLTRIAKLKLDSNI